MIYVANYPAVCLLLLYTINYSFIFNKKTNTIILILTIIDEKVNKQ